MRPVYSPEEFAKAVAEHIAEFAVDGTVHFDKDKFSLVVKSGTGNPLQTINLSKFYADYQSVPETLSDILQTIASLARGVPDISNYDSIAPYLMPGTFDRARMYLNWKNAKRMHGSATGDPILMGMADVFVFAPIIDMGDSIVHVTTNHLNMWQRSRNQVVDQAGDNLQKRTEHYNFSSILNVKNDMPESHESMWGDDYAASRLLYGEVFLDGAPVLGDMLIFMPTPSKLIITGTGSTIGIAQGLSELEKVSKDRNALPPFVVMWKNGRFSNYVPDKQKEPAFHAALHRLQTHYFGRSYHFQKEELLADADVLINDLFVAEFTVAQNQDGRLASACAWTEGVETLLPKADSIMFVQTENGEGKVAARTSWDRAYAMISHLLEQTSDFPPRFKTKQFPNAQQLSAMGIHDLFNLPQSHP